MNNYTYKQYCEDLDYFLPIIESNQLNEGFLDTLKGIKGSVGEILSYAKNQIADAVGDVKIGANELIKAFKDRNIFSVLKSFKFSLKKMLSSIHKATGLINGGVIKIFNELHKTKVFQKIKSGAIKIDEVLEKYPILKKLTGPIVAGILIYIWLNMAFVGNFDYDMDITSWFSALTGNFSIEELFASPQGMTMLAFLATGMLSGGVLSVSWLGSTAANLSTAITYVALKKIRADKNIINNLKKKITMKESEMKSFKNYVDDQLIEQNIIEYLILSEMTLTEQEEIFGDVINEGKLDSLLHKAGLHIHKGKGLIQYLMSAGKGIGKMVVAAIKGDKEGVKKIAQSIDKGDVLDFLLKLDTATLHLVTGPLHLIDAVTGWHLWAAVKDKAEGAKNIIDKIKQALVSVKNNVVKVFKDPTSIKNVNTKIDDLQSTIGV